MVSQRNERVDSLLSRPDWIKNAKFAMQCEAISFLPPRRTYHVRQKRHQLFRVLEAPTTHVESLDVFSDKLVRVEGGVPCLELDVAEHHVVHVPVWRDLGDWRGDGAREVRCSAEGGWGAWVHSGLRLTRWVVKGWNIVAGLSSRFRHKKQVYNDSK